MIADQILQIVVEDGRLPAEAELLQVDHTVVCLGHCRPLYRWRFKPFGMGRGAGRGQLARQKSSLNIIQTEILVIKDAPMSSQVISW